MVEKSIGRVKGRWKAITRQKHCLIKIASYSIMAACILHNILESRREVFDDAWLEPPEHCQLNFGVIENQNCRLQAGQQKQIPLKKWE